MCFSFVVKAVHRKEEEGEGIGQTLEELRTSLVCWYVFAVLYRYTGAVLNFAQNTGMHATIASAAV